MKKIILSLAFVALLISCKEETRAKVKEASVAVGSEVKTAAKKTKEKVAKVIDTAKLKQKVNKAIAKSAEVIEEGAKKVKESATKK